jgi:hypothetical protein
MHMGEIQIAEEKRPKNWPVELLKWPKIENSVKISKNTKIV